MLCSILDIRQCEGVLPLRGRHGTRHGGAALDRGTRVCVGSRGM